MNFVSIICPIYNEEKYIKNCIESILNQDYPSNNFEVIFIDGLSIDNTREIILYYAKSYPNIKLLDNPQKYVPQALNIGIKESTGDIIMRIDAHSTYPKNYISLLVKMLYDLKADNIGVCCKTLPSQNTITSISIAIASSHIFGVGNSKFRIGIKDIVETDTVPFGCYRRSVFDKIGYFDDELIRNQDDEFNGRLKKNGGKIFLIPDIEITYFARNSISKMFMMYYQYGLFKPLVNKKLGSPTTIRQLIPVLFVFFIFGGVLLSIYSHFILITLIIILSIYILISFYFSFEKAYEKKNINLIFYMPLIFFLIHISYGIGYWVGMYNILFKKKFNV